MKRNYDHWEHMIKRSDNADSGESSHVCFFRIYFMVTFITFITFYIDMMYLKLNSLYGMLYIYIYIYITLAEIYRWG